jgi:membrane-associated protease RseP (regulator of RpoE activity)
MSDPTPPVSSTYELYRPVDVFVVSPPRRRYWLHLLLLLATFFTTLVVGSRLQFNFDHNLPAFSLSDDALPLFPVTWALRHPQRLLLGLPFSLTLMFILLAHEMGHFLMCVRYGVYATLPFFIPAPTLIGTLGAFIRIKSPIRSRAALFDIGIAGPIAGFVVAVVVLFFALTMSKPLPAGMGASDIQFGFPLIFDLVHRAVEALMPAQRGPVFLPLDRVYLHPTAVAAWVGMFATALNLLPGGQLDGGHIVYSLFPRAHKWVSRLTMLLLLPMGVFFWAGWLVWALLLGISGMRHPQVPLWTEVGTGRRRLALLALFMLAVTLVPAPFGVAGVVIGRH